MQYRLLLGQPEQIPTQPPSASRVRLADSAAFAQSTTTAGPQIFRPSFQPLSDHFSKRQPHPQSCPSILVPDAHAISAQKNTTMVVQHQLAKL